MKNKLPRNTFGFIKYIDHIFEKYHLLLLRYRAVSRLNYILNYKLVIRNFFYRISGGPDGLPLPTPKLVFLVTWQYNVEDFYRNGKVGIDSINYILKKSFLSLSNFNNILDFGCGSGRTFRFLAKYKKSKAYGTDYNPKLIRWCRNNLKFGNFSVNALNHKLEYPNNKFDFIYAISVFTHLPEKLQHFWMNELRRVLRPGGYLLITTHGKSRIKQLGKEEQKKFNSGKLVVQNLHYAGSNMCGAFHPKSYIVNKLARELTLIDFVPDGAKDARQDYYLLQKKP